MKKTYRELTPLEALKRMADNGGPVQGLRFRNGGIDLGQPYDEELLVGVSLLLTKEHFITSRGTFRQCAELIETAPEPWDFDSVPSAMCWLRRKVGASIDANYMITCCRADCVLAHNIGVIAYADLAANWEHSFDRVLWLPCTK